MTQNTMHSDSRTVFSLLEKRDICYYKLWLGYYKNAKIAGKVGKLRKNGLYKRPFLKGSIFEKCFFKS